MILWTIQKEKAWERLQRRGYLIATIENIMEESWVSAYRWMADQMKKRLGPPPYADCFPVWTWYQWESAKRKCPDLRAGGHLSKNERGVRIEFECHENAALLSDFELWHYVLNYWYLPESEADGEAFEAEIEREGLSFFKTKPLLHPEYHEKIVRSWDKIFALDWTEPDLASPRDQKSIQSTVWQLKIDQVRSYKHFKSR
jgi:hypothetical protein